MGRPKSTNPRVFAAYRLPRATIAEIKRLAKLNSTPKKKCSEADVIVRAVGSKKLEPSLAEQRRLANNRALDLIMINAALNPPQRVGRSPILKPSAKAL